MNPKVTGFFHAPSASITYVVAEPEGARCAVVDPVLDFDHGAARTSTVAADKVVDFVRRNGFKVEWILETHAHADRLSAAPYINERLGGRIGIGEHIVNVQKTWKGTLNLGDEFKDDGSAFDHLFKEGERFTIGALAGEVLYTPGHTAADVTYVIGDTAFIGDTLFMSDYGTARADFPGGDARELYHSIRRILALPPETRLFLCHDYLGPGRAEHKWETTVAEQRAHNVHVHDGVTEDAFVKLRTERDKLLAPPPLLFAAVQVNMRAGRLPAPEANGVSYLKIPVDLI